MLIVDDNPINRFVAKTIVEKEGVQTEEAKDGAQCLRMIRSKAASISDGFYALVLMDLNMPVMDGIQAMIQIRTMVKKGEIKEVKVCALTAFDSERIKEECKSAGMHDFLLKPVQKVEIIEVMRKFGVLKDK